MVLFHDYIHTSKHAHITTDSDQEKYIPKYSDEEEDDNMDEDPSLFSTERSRWIRDSNGRFVANDEDEAAFYLKVENFKNTGKNRTSATIYQLENHQRKSLPQSQTR